MRLTTTTAATMIDLLRDRAAAQPDECAYTFLDDGEAPGASFTWRQLERRSRAVAAEIARRVPPGARVLVMFPPSLDFIPAFLGVLYAGAIAVPAYPPTGARADRTASRLSGMIEDAGVGLVVAPSGLAARAAATDAGVPGLRGLPCLDPAVVPDECADEWRPRTSRPADVAFLQYTSGSTSSPRGVMVTHGNLLHNLEQTEADARYGRESVSLSWLPVNHDMGLINGILQPVYSGCTAYVMSPAAFLQRPARWLQAVSRLGVTHSGGPNFAFDLCVRRVTDDDASTLDLSTWRVAYNGSEPVRRATLEDFQRRFGVRGFRWDAFSPAYGLAESTLLVSSVPAGVPPVFHGDAVASGTVDMRSHVRIVEPASRVPVPHGTVGEIWVAGASVAPGYWKRPDDTAATFEARTAGGEGPFLRTGDLGFIADGRLFVTGRIKDVLIVRGAKHYPQDLERTAEGAHPALRPGCCAAFAVERDGCERVAIVAEIDPRMHARPGGDCSQVLASIRLAVASSHHVTASTVALVAPGVVPKTTSGKLQRFLCREALVTGTLDAIEVWTEGDAPAEQAAS